MIKNNKYNQVKGNNIDTIVDSRDNDVDPFKVASGTEPKKDQKLHARFIGLNSEQKKKLTASLKKSANPVKTKVNLAEKEKAVLKMNKSRLLLVVLMLALAVLGCIMIFSSTKINGGGSSDPSTPTALTNVGCIAQFVVSKKLNFRGSAS